MPAFFGCSALFSGFLTGFASAFLVGVSTGYFHRLGRWLDLSGDFLSFGRRLRLVEIDGLGFGQFGWLLDDVVVFNWFHRIGGQDVGKRAGHGWLDRLVRYRLDGFHCRRFDGGYLDSLDRFRLRDRLSLDRFHRFGVEHGDHRDVGDGARVEFGDIACCGLVLGCVAEQCDAGIGAALDQDLFIVATYDEEHGDRYMERA